MDGWPGDGEVSVIEVELVARLDESKLTTVTSMPQGSL